MLNVVSDPDIINKVYLHSINIKDPVVCNNFAIPSPLSSVAATNLFAFQQPKEA
jgi:hypothetical protein